MKPDLYSSNLQWLFSDHRISSGNEQNLESLKQFKPEWQTRLERLQADGFERHGIYFHSRRDPQREAQRQIQHTLEDKKNHLVFLGAGLGYPLQAALENPLVESVLVMEADPEIFYYCLSLMPFNTTKKDIYFYYCPDPESDSLENILPFFQNKNLDKVSVYQHRPSFQVSAQIPGNKFAALEKQLSSIMYKRAINQATIIKFQGLWNKNIALNIKQIIQGNTLTNLIEKLKGQMQNIVLCGAGPSLEQSIPNLLRLRDRYFLICVDTAFIPLTKYKIQPDIVISADPQWINHYFAISPVAAKSLWLMDPVVSYQSSHFLDKSGAKIYWWDNPFYLDLIIRDFQSRGEISHGGSVSTNGFDLAMKLKPANIILAGQDLSFSHKTAHVKGAVLESMVFLKNNRFHGFEMHNLRQMKSLPPKKVKQCIQKNDTLYTNDKLHVFIDWFESQMNARKKQSNIKFYNATDRGVFLQGFHHDTLEHILQNSDIEHNSKIALMDMLKESPAHSIKSNLDKFLELAKGCNELQKLYYQNLTLARKSKGASGNKLNEIYRQLNQNDERIKTHPEVNQILSINAQSTILKITEHGNDNEHSAVQLYKAMYISAQRLNYFIKKIVSILTKFNA